MTFLFLLAILLPLAALTLSALARGRSSAPWLALATVIVGTAPAFTVSVTLVTWGEIGEMFGHLVPCLFCLVTAVYGLAGLGIFASTVRLRPAAFAPLGAILAGAIYTASFHAYLPPYNFSPIGMLLFATPGPALVVYGACLWRRNGLSGALQAWNPGLRLVIALGIVAAFGAGGLFVYQTVEPDRPNWASRPIDLPRLASNSVLVVEGEVIAKEARSREAQLSGGGTRTFRYTYYRVAISESWRGDEAGTLPIVVADWSPVDLAQGQSYLLFFSGMANQKDFPGYWELIVPRMVWTLQGDAFHSHFGLEPAAVLSRQRLNVLLAENPLSTPTPQPG